jgi:hypothetical protein
MKDIQIVDIADFINNPFIEFAKVVKPAPKKPNNDRSLKTADRLFMSAIAFLIATVLIGW